MAYHSILEIKDIEKIFKDDKVFRLKIRNSNYKNIPVFSNLDAIFDYEMRYGSKQDI